MKRVWGPGVGGKQADTCDDEGAAYHPWERDEGEIWDDPSCGIDVTEVDFASIISYRSVGLMNQSPDQQFTYPHLHSIPKCQF